MRNQRVSRSKALFFGAISLGLMVAFQNCAAPTPGMEEMSSTSARPLQAVEMTKSSHAEDTQSFEGVHQLVVLENDSLEIKTACGPNRVARIRNLDSQEGILEAEGEIALRIDQIRVKEDGLAHIMGCLSQAMVETEELLEQLGRVERARRDGSRVYFTTAEGLILTFEFVE